MSAAEFNANGHFMVDDSRMVVDFTCLMQDCGTSTLWLLNIAMENGPFIDGLPGFTY